MTRMRLGQQFLLALLIVCLVGGCASSSFLSVRKTPRNPLEKPLQLLSWRGPKPTSRTAQVLRRLDLEELQARDPRQALMRLHQEIVAEPNPEKYHAFAELAYIRGKLEATRRPR